MFATNNRVKRRPSPYEMEITDGESAYPPPLLEPPEGEIMETTPRCLTWMGGLPWNPKLPKSLPC